jgi:HEAT repeat protein
MGQRSAAGVGTRQGWAVRPAVAGLAACLGLAGVTAIFVALSTGGGPLSAPTGRSDVPESRAAVVRPGDASRAPRGTDPVATGVPAPRSGTTDLAETIARFRDPATPFVERRRATFRLARNGSPEALAVLMEALLSASPAHAAWLAQLMGALGGAGARALLRPLVDGPDERLAAAAIRGLCAGGGGKTVERLALLLADPSRSPALRATAARGLGTLGGDDARDALAAALDAGGNDDLTRAVLDGLGRFPFPDTAPLVARYFAAPATPPHLRVAMVEALAHSSEESVHYLLRLSRDHPDPEVRAAAAWAISAHVEVTELGPPLTALIGTERDEGVRRRLYEALLPQESVAAGRLLELTLSEEDLPARVAGFNAAGHAVRRDRTLAAARDFDGRAVPELLALAKSGTSANLRMRAVFALRRAGTAAALAALGEIAARAGPPMSTAAANGLRAHAVVPTGKEAE